MTIILLTVISTTILSLLFYRQIRQYRYIIYGAIIIISIITTDDANIISLGYVPAGVFIVVMFAGVLEKGVLRKRLFMVRAEIAIIGSILIAPHAFGYLEYFLDDIGFFQGNLSFYIGILSIIVMLPLLITSFRIIRKQLQYKQWKRLHLLSYIFYGLVGLHLILIQNDRMWLYIILFGSYFLLKLGPKWRIPFQQKHLRTES